MSGKKLAPMKQPHRIEPIFDASGALRRPAPTARHEDDRKTATLKDPVEGSGPAVR
jgi:hypothetical protein